MCQYLNASLLEYLEACLDPLLCVHLPTETNRSTAVCTASPTRLTARRLFSLVVDESRDFSLKLTRVEICVTNGTSVVSMDFVLISSDLAAENPLLPEEVMAVGIRPV